MTATDLFTLTNRIVLVTGGTGILGGAMAEGLVAAGANVALLARDSTKAKAMLGKLSAGPGRAMAVSGDVLDRPSLERAAETIGQAWGPVDTLINCAGGNKPAASTNPERTFFDLPVEALRDVMDVNVLGTMLPCQVFARGMVESGEGVILNVSSMNAFRPLTRIPAYSASKAGVSNFTQWLAVHMAQNYSPRIRVNAIAPGFFLTPLNHYLLMDEQSGELSPRGKAIIAHTPQGRFGAPDELIGTMLWLLSAASAFVTGIVVPVDGGFSAYSGV